MKIGNEVKIYGDDLFAHKPTIKSIILNYLYSKFVKRERHKNSVYRENSKFVDRTIQVGDLEITNLAIVIDNKVVEVLRMQSRAANLLMDEDATLVEFDPKESIVAKGMRFTGEGFEK